MFEPFLQGIYFRDIIRNAVFLSSKTNNCPTVGKRLEHIHKMDHNITFIIDA